MDNQKNKSGQPFDEDANDSKRQESSESGSSYYYSYGPFQSYGKTNEEPGQGADYERSQPEEVEVTKPQPLKPFPSSYDVIRSTVEPTNGSSGDGRNNLPAAKAAIGNTIANRRKNLRYVR